MVMKTASKDECISEIIGTFILILIGMTFPP
jgi:glycerol uptake facilitator-like aquaporin